MSKFNPTQEQKRVLDYSGKNLIVSASAGSGKTSTLIEFVARKIVEGQPLKRIMLLTFTKAAANEMKERLNEKLLSFSENSNVLDALDDISTSDISTIHSFLEKLIKRNLNLIDDDEGFRVLSEDEMFSVKEQAFVQSELSFKEINYEGYEKLFLSLHNNRQLVFEILESMLSFFASQFDSESKIEYYKSHQKEIFNESLSYIKSKYRTQCDQIVKKLSIIKSQFNEDKYTSYCQELIDAFTLKNNEFESLREIAYSSFKAPPALKSCDKLILEELKDIYQSAKKIREELADLNLDNDEIYKSDQVGQLEVLFYELFEIYQKMYSSLKQSQNAVDFNDLEKYASQILKQEEISLELQESYDFIFVDEYQDTNRIQENLIKQIAKKSHFVAVGDPKQSIYGFRNATSDIIKNDIKDFIADEDSSAEFLRQNFRSDGRVLDFVNNVFENIMTEESVGIDYKKTSILESGKEFLRDKTLPTVRIDDVAIEKSKEEETQSVYDIMKDSNTETSSKNLQAKVIALRINELMMKQIYDDKIGQLRNVRYNDIAILTRGKNELIGEIIKELALRGIPVVSEIKGDFKSNPEILVIINLFKILLDFQDDISLISVMLSKFGGFTIDEIARLKLSSQQKEFYNIIKSSQEEKVKQFLNMLDKLKFDFEVNGAYIMLENLINKTNYRLYLMSKPNGQNEMFVFNKFLEQLKTSSMQYDLPSLIKFFESDNLIYRGGGNSANAVSIGTIHSSKGLEYPIVILVDTGKAILSPYRKNYILNEKFGLALNYFSRSVDEIFLTPTLYMLKEIEKKKALIDEIMLLYVAMTRAKNHLYIVGELSEKTRENISKSPLEAKSYLEMIFSAYKKLQKGSIENDGIEVNTITEIEDVKVREKEINHLSDQSTIEKIKRYFDFKYRYADAVKTIFKNSVSSINSENKQIEIVGHDDNEFVERGNAYHLALKLLDFENINDVQDIENKFKENIELINIEKLINKELLLKNIKIIKKIIKNSKKIFKEQQFTSLINLSQIGLNDFNENIMVQGIVDLFALGDENVLIDYKFTNATDDEVLKRRYNGQLVLYREAIEKAYKIKIDKIYLLSLKYGKLIEI